MNDGIGGTDGYDNSWLKPYLRAIRDAESGALPVDSTDEVFQNVWLSGQVAGSDAEYPGAGKIRQVMYIAKLARKDKTTNCLVLTDAGSAYIVEPDIEGAPV